MAAAAHPALDKALNSTLNAAPPVPCLPLLLGLGVDQSSEPQYNPGWLRGLGDRMAAQTETTQAPGRSVIPLIPAKISATR